jgi:hypothetical protein
VTRYRGRLNQVGRKLGVLALTSACTTLAPSESSLPPGTVRLAEPEIYRDWYQKTEACSGRTGEFSTIQFYVVPGVDSFPTEEGAKVGWWILDGGTNRIVLAGNLASQELVVRHEMLHALLQRPGHPTEYFVDRCHLTWESWNSDRGE